ncbi:hypothetical protein SARC_03367 [Sphaeroforma arctica JP610]|uniref:YCII-related domain-containing protein n=1 Tax=Sphaeroforma arctica JP610 TaxID=667725 RepID=A0A0L0G5V1_9EUKA|nr:hypothetical protein SARC_03367 [Sphaeroforma arctica JP610]KNC84405.1 hypothetical protein SARC_03367 [Sphaeroforma arctica JP610]|eukprot:XP_014158307.1 hypothetical protein SARC_03367 [Sphaeroforma arctica JP610]
MLRVARSAFSTGTVRRMPQFVVVAYDGKDEGALDRRMAVRGDHLEGAMKLKKAGHLISGGALLDSNGKMMGSMMTVEFASEQELRKVSWKAVMIF